MIDDLLKDAHLNKSPTLNGISNVIQNTAPHDVLILPAKSEDQLNQLIKNHLPAHFEGLLLSPFAPENNSLNYKVMPVSELKSWENKLIEYFYPEESVRPPILGVTGTNGKTSVCWLFSELGKIANKNVLYLGTLGVFVNGSPTGDKIYTTTPSYLDFRKNLFKYGKGIDAIAIEVSSHALEQGRLRGLRLRQAAWTNFTQDHLDFHKTMDNYFQAKVKIKNLLEKEKSILVPRQESELINKLKSHAEVNETKPLSEFKVSHVPDVFLQGFPLRNLELALSAYAGIFEESSLIMADRLTLPPGRFEVVEKKGRTFIVDYAHTPDALTNVLAQIKDSYPSQKIWVVFGCGGDRDRNKRPLMAKAAAERGDFIMVTSDNPRTEDPHIIIEDIIKGLGDIPYEKEPDRKRAITNVYHKSSEGDVILIAGKGHETYQEINGKRFDFDDKKIVKELE